MVRHPIRGLQRRIDRRRRDRVARMPLDDVDLPEQLDHPDFEALPDDEQERRRRWAVATVARRQRRNRRGVGIGALILFATVGFVASDVQQVHTNQINEVRARQNLDARIAAERAHDTAVNRYNQCVGTNASLGRIRDGIIRASPDVSTRGVTDPATLTRIETTNRQRRATRTFFRNLIPTVRCGPDPSRRPKP